MASIFDKLKSLQQQVEALEAEYNENYEELKERKEKIRQNMIFDDLDSLYIYKGSLESELGIPSVSYDNYDRSCNFYHVFAFVWKYLESSNNLIEPTDENIRAYGEYLFNDPNGLFTEEELETVRCGVDSLDTEAEKIEHQFYTSSFEHPVYKIAAICLRLESLGFRTTYELEQTCNVQSTNLSEMKLALRDYKIAIGTSLVKGATEKVEQTVDSVVIPTVNNVIKPNVTKGLKLLAKKFIKPDDSDNEE